MLSMTWPRTQEDPSAPGATLLYEPWQRSIAGRHVANSRKWTSNNIPFPSLSVIASDTPDNFTSFPSGPRPLQIPKRQRNLPFLRRARRPELRGGKGGATLDVYREPGFSASVGFVAGS